MARMCCDTRKSVRQTAITYLQRALLAYELQNLSSREWESCFLQVRVHVYPREQQPLPVFLYEACQTHTYDSMQGKPTHNVLGTLLLDP